MLLYTPRSPKTASQKVGSSTDSIASSSVKDKSTSPAKAQIETQKKVEDAHPIDGKIPTEATLGVMKMVLSATKSDPRISAKSNSSTLRQIRTEPTLKLLKQTSWKDFFTAEQNPRNAQAERPSSGLARVSIDENTPATTSRLSNRLRTSSSEFVPNSQQAFTQQISFEPEETINPESNLQGVFSALVNRVETLWATLKVPATDVKFYRETLCSGAPRGLSHCRELARYIKTLHNHRMAVTNVLQAIEKRELLITHLYAVLSAFNRKMLYRKSYEQQVGPKATSPGTSLESNLSWKEDLVEVLKDIQKQTVEVIKAIQWWRKGLWRPLTFNWRGVDYLAKIKTDLQIIGTDIYMNQLQTIPIYKSDLVCLLFEDEESTEPESEGIMPFGSTGQSASSHQLRDYFLGGNISSNELKMAAKVVSEDRKLQRAIATEREALLTKRVFIPTLKVDIIQPADPVRTNPYHNKYHAHVHRPEHTASHEPQLYSTLKGATGGRFAPPSRDHEDEQ